jgi:hypothetical protein
MRVELVEHKVPKKTVLGTVEKSLNQWLVLAGADDGQMKQIGVLGMHKGAKLLATCVDLEPEQVAAVAQACSEELGRKVVPESLPVDVMGVQTLEDLDIEDGE